jgi:hypothetical protein
MGRSLNQPGWTCNDPISSEACVPRFPEVSSVVIIYWMITPKPSAGHRH